VRVLRREPSPEETASGPCTPQGRLEERRLDRLRQLLLAGRLHGWVRGERILADARAGGVRRRDARLGAAETVERISPARDPAQGGAADRVVAHLRGKRDEPREGGVRPGDERHERARRVEEVERG